MMGCPRSQLLTSETKILALFLGRNRIFRYWQPGTLLTLRAEHCYTVSGKALLNSLDNCFDKWELSYFFCSCKNSSKWEIGCFMTEKEVNGVSVNVTVDWYRGFLAQRVEEVGLRVYHASAGHVMLAAWLFKCELPVLAVPTAQNREDGRNE